MVFSNNFPDRIYDLYKDSKRRFVGNLPPDVMSFPDQQGAQLFLAGQNTVYAMTRPPEPEQPQEEEKKNTSNSNNDRTNSNNDEKINTTKQENPNSSGSILRKIYRPLAPTRPKLRKSRRKQQRPNTKSSSSSTLSENCTVRSGCRNVRRCSIQIRIHSTKFKHRCRRSRGWGNLHDWHLISVHNERHMTSVTVDGISN